MLTLSLIGIGCGDPEQLTRAAIGAINAADLVLIPRKGTAKSDLGDLIRKLPHDVRADVEDAALKAAIDGDTASLIAHAGGYLTARLAVEKV